MELQTLGQLAEKGMGFIAFGVLIVAGAKVWKFMDLLVNNHLTHIQESLEKIEGHLGKLADK